MTLTAPKSLRRTAFSLLIVSAAMALMAFATPVAAQEAAVPGVEAGGLSARVVQLFLLVTVLSMAPGIAMMVTCLPFMVIESRPLSR